MRDGPEYDFVAVFFDENFCSGESEGTRQADGLAPSMLEDLGGVHSYI